MGRKSSLMQVLSDLEAAPLIRPGLDKACPLSEAHRARLYADEYAFLETEIGAAFSRYITLRRLIGIENNTYLFGLAGVFSLRRHVGDACPYFWTERARHLLRHLEEERLRHLDLLDRRQRLELEVEDAHLRIVLRDPSAETDYDNLSSSREWQCLPGSWADVDREEASEQDIGAPCTEAKTAPLFESAQHVRLRPPHCTRQDCAV